MCRRGSRLHKRRWIVRFEQPDAVLHAPAVSGQPHEALPGRHRAVDLEMDGDGEAAPLTADYTGTSRQPMFWHDRIYFPSDRDGTMNIWSMDRDGTTCGSTPHQATSTCSRPRCPRDGSRYQLGADLHVYDIAADRDTTVADHTRL